MKIETYTDGKGETRFRVVAENGQITLTPHEGYTRKEDCHRAIEENLGALVKQAMDGIRVIDEDGAEQLFIVAFDVHPKVHMMPVGSKPKEKD